MTVPDLEAVERLEQAKERLFECGWGQFGASLRDDETSLCLEEAITGERGTYLTASDMQVDWRIFHYLRKVTGAPLPFFWNDRQKSAGPVFDAIDKAIQMAKEHPYSEAG